MPSPVTQLFAAGCADHRISRICCPSNPSWHCHPARLCATPIQIGVHAARYRQCLLPAISVPDTCSPGTPEFMKGRIHEGIFPKGPPQGFPRDSWRVLLTPACLNSVNPGRCLALLLCFGCKFSRSFLPWGPHWLLLYEPLFEIWGS